MDTGRKWFISNISILLVVSLLVFDGEESHCFGISSPLYESPEITVFVCFTQWIRPFDTFWLLVSTGFWRAWATPLGFLGPFVVSIKPHVLHGRVVCVVAAMKT